MAVVSVFNCKGEKISEIELADAVFNISVKPSILHDVVTMQLAKRRSGSACVKRRGEVSGSTRKLFRQKGTGRARRGDIKSPLLRGGGIVFGPKPRSYAFDLPKKVKKLGLKMALSSKFKEDKLVVLNELQMAVIKTKDFLEIAKALNAENALFVTPQKDDILERSTRNVNTVKVIREEGLNVYDVLKYEKIILLERSIKGIEGRLLA